MHEVRRIEITTRHLVRDIVAGEYSSAFRGRGVEFAEVREYQPGDDVRSIDWNVTARLGSAYVKRYLEERELTVGFVVDFSASKRFGSRLRTKGELATEVCAVLALAAAPLLASGRRLVGLVVVLPGIVCPLLAVGQPDTLLAWLAFVGLAPAAVFAALGALLAREA